LVEFSRLKRQSFKGIVDVVYGGEKPPPAKATEQPQKKLVTQPKDHKRKANDSLEGPPVSQSGEAKPLSKRQTKKNKKAKLDAL
jgi:ribonuclease P/MRP protein subunit RPP1